MIIRIAQVTISHSRYDKRIFIKQCSSLSKLFSVSLYVSDGNGYEKRNNVHIFDIGKKYRRLARFFILPFLTLKIIWKENYDIYHLHDPELLLIVPFLKIKGKIIIFDSHEDIPLQMLSKPYLNQPTLKIISCLYKIFQSLILPYVDGVITATPFIKNKLSKLNSNTIDIKNYPITNND